MTARVRTATEDDSAAVASLWLDWGREYEGINPVLFRVPSEDGLTSWFKRQIAEATDDDLWLAGESDGEVVGFERAIISRPGEDSEWAINADEPLVTMYLWMLAVHPAARRGGLGAALVSAAEEWGRDHGAERASVFAMSDSPTAVPFYRSRGFRPMSIGFWKPL